MDGLFTSSIHFDNQSLTELITSLGQLAVGMLESPPTHMKKGSTIDHVKGVSSKHQINEGESIANINTFAITRLVETCLVNISRIEIVWKILVSILTYHEVIDRSL